MLLPRKWFFNFFFTIIISTLIEIMQSFTTRNFSNDDLFYNFLGIFLASMSIYLINLINLVKNKK